MSLPYKIRRTTWLGRAAELMTFTGTTEAEYDVFLDARFADGRESIGFRRDSAAPAAFLTDETGAKSVQLRWLQFRRSIES